jgi:hypothetical protein
MLSPTRFIVVLYPVSFNKLTPSGSVRVILLIWLTSMALTLPYGIHMDYEIVGGVAYCREGWPESVGPGDAHEWHRKVFGIATASLQFGLPCLVITFCYTK